MVIAIDIVPLMSISFFTCSSWDCLLSLPSAVFTPLRALRLTNFFIKTASRIEIGINEKNVLCQPRISIIFAPASIPTTDPPLYAAVNIPIPIASFFTGSISLMILNATGIEAILKPCIILAAIKK
jgi:hypothetical protein